MGFTSAVAYHEARKEIIMISTGSREVDKILGGGV